MSTRWDPDPEALRSRSPANTPAVIDPSSLRRVLPGRYVWDFWPIQTPDGFAADFGGRTGWVALSVPSGIEPEDRHFIATLRLASSRGDDAEWTDHGELFEAGAIGARQWAGSAVYRGDGRLDVFYTACGIEGEVEPTFEQRIVHAVGRLDTAALTASDWSPHQVILEGDGRTYASTMGEKAVPGRMSAFRDPAYLRDPADGSEYLVFTATVARSGSEYDGAVGTARWSGRRWELLPPLVTAVGVNKELERPHVVIRDGRYYLFLTSHHWTFAPGRDGPEGLYGFVADDLAGPYRPLNGSGLVLGNPASEPHQAYSWLVLEDGSVLSFADYPGMAGRDLEEEAGRDPGFKKGKFGGTVAPKLHLTLEGETAKLT